MSRLATVELFKGNMKFSAGHFTVFSSTKRENLHGHNYTVYASLTTLLEDEGLSFDYRFYKEILNGLCDELDETVLLAGLCKHHKIVDEGDYWCVYFNGEKLMFLKRDATILPIYNTTIEELSNWFLQKLLLGRQQLELHRIQGLEIKVQSGTGRSGSAAWTKDKE